MYGSNFTQQPTCRNLIFEVFKERALEDVTPSQQVNNSIAIHPTSKTRWLSGGGFRKVRLIKVDES